MPLSTLFSVITTPCDVQSSPIQSFDKWIFQNCSLCVWPLTCQILRKSVCTTTTRATWCTHRPTPHLPTPDKRRIYSGFWLLLYPAFLYQKLACFQMFFMQMLIYFVFIQMKTALTICVALHCRVLVQFSPVSGSYKQMRVWRIRQMQLSRRPWRIPQPGMEIVDRLVFDFVEKASGLTTPM